MTQNTLNFTFDDSLGDLIIRLTFEKFLDEGFVAAKKLLSDSLFGNEISDSIVYSLLLGEYKFIAKNDELIYVKDDCNKKYHLELINCRIKSELDNILFTSRESNLRFLLSDVSIDISSAMRKYIAHGYTDISKIKQFYSKETLSLLSTLQDFVNAPDKLIECYNVLLNATDVKSSFVYEAKKKIALYSKFNEKIIDIKNIVTNNIIDIEEIDVDEIYNLIDDFSWLYGIYSSGTIDLKKDTEYLFPNGLYIGVESTKSRLIHLDLADTYNNYFDFIDFDNDYGIIKIQTGSFVQYRNNGDCVTDPQFEFIRNYCELQT